MHANPSNKWITTLRIVALVVAVSLTVTLFFLSRGLMLIWFKLGIVTTVILVGSFALGGHIAKRRTIIGWGLAGAAMLGTVGFIIGFFKPELFGAEGNLAPLSGVFWTGPIGFTVGAMLGSVAGWIRAQPRTFKGSDRKALQPKPAISTNPKVKDEIRTSSN